MKVRGLDEGVLISPVVCDSIDCRTLELISNLNELLARIIRWVAPLIAANRFVTEEGAVLLAIHLERRKGCSVQCGGMIAGWH